MSLERDFLKFEGAPSGYERGRVRVTINDKGQIYLNRKAHEELGKPQAVNLYYSPARQVIAVEPANPRVGAPFPLKQRDHGGLMINAQRMLRHHRIVIDGPEVFTRPEIGSDGILLLDLHTTTRTGGWTANRGERESESNSDSESDEDRDPAKPGSHPESREEKRERLALDEARKIESRDRERKTQQRRRESAQKNAAELTRREARVAAARTRSKRKLSG